MRHLPGLTTSRWPAWRTWRTSWPSSATPGESCRPRWACRSARGCCKSFRRAAERQPDELRSGLEAALLAGPSRRARAVRGRTPPGPMDRRVRPGRAARRDQPGAGPALHALDGRSDRRAGDARPGGRAGRRHGSRPPPWPSSRSPRTSRPRRGETGSVPAARVGRRSDLIDGAAPFAKRRAGFRVRRRSPRRPGPAGASPPSHPGRIPPSRRPAWRPRCTHRPARPRAGHQGAQLLLDLRIGGPRRGAGRDTRREEKHLGSRDRHRYQPLPRSPGSDRRNANVLASGSAPSARTLSPVRCGRPAPGVVATIMTGLPAASRGATDRPACQSSTMSVAAWAPSTSPCTSALSLGIDPHQQHRREDEPVRQRIARRVDESRDELRDGRQRPVNRGLRIGRTVPRRLDGRLHRVRRRLRGSVFDVSDVAFSDMRLTSTGVGVLGSRPLNNHLITIRCGICTVKAGPSPSADAPGRRDRS